MLTTKPGLLNTAHAGLRVRVDAPQGSAFDGRAGVIRRVVGETALVQLDPLVGRVATWPELPFGLAELTGLSAAVK